MSQTIHIVCLDAPAPPNYGGAIDMYYKIKALAEVGHTIILHYFDYHPLRNAQGLEKFCSAIFSYRRKSLLQSLPFREPFIVQSRINFELVNRLNADDNPILLEGLHCSGILPLIQSAERTIIRMHNEEAAYYRHLADTETNPLKRIYFRHESKLLERYQQRLDKNIRLACLSGTDIDTFRNQYQFRQVEFIPCFIPWEKLNSMPGKGGYCLYHGNMAVSENEEATIWLIDNVFNDLNIPFWIAGKGISKRLSQKAQQHNHVKLISEPSIKEINELVANAQINVLPSMNRTGVKLKVLNALFNGRFCITNGQGVEGSQIAGGIVVQDEPEAWKQEIRLLFDQEFTASNLQERAALTLLYSAKQNAQKLSALW